MADLSDTSRWWFNCVCVCVRVCVRASECVCESVCPKTCRHISVLPRIEIGHGAA